MYFQVIFALDRVKALAPQHPEWKDKEPFASLLKGDVKGALAGGDTAMVDIVMATHAGMTTEEFEQIVKDWLATARHPRFKRPYTELVYQPMVELLAYLRANGFKTVRLRRRHRVHAPVDSKGLRHPARTGLRQHHQDEVRNARRQAGAQCACRRSTSSTTRPASRWASTNTSAASPSLPSAIPTGDQQMLEWTQRGSGARLVMLVHHDDAEREWAYGPESRIGTFSDALMAEARQEVDGHQHEERLEADLRVRVGGQTGAHSIGRVESDDDTKARIAPLRHDRQRKPAPQPAGVDHAIVSNSPTSEHALPR